MRTWTKRITATLTGIVLTAVLAGCAGQVRYSAEVYRRTDGRELTMHMFHPPRGKATKAALIFVHGGGWSSGKPDLFFRHCRYFARRGALAASVQYRLASEEGTGIERCVEDVQFGVGWVRSNADRLGIDPDRIALAGDSAGGHLAACAALLEEPRGTRKGSRPDALALLGAVLNTGEGKWKRGGAHARQMSPLHLVRTGAPPTLAMHGSADRVVSPKQAVEFSRRMRAAGNRCELVLLKGAGHAFVLPGYGRRSDVWTAVERIDSFLVRHGYLKGEPDFGRLWPHAIK